MNDAGPALATAAASLVGTPFRLLGRDPARGLDCVGLIAASLALIGRSAAAPESYRLRNREIDRELAFAAAAKLYDADGPMAPGDVVLVRAGPAQFHLLIAANGGGFVHAHAALGRVTHSPGPLTWPVERHWRLAPD